MANITTWTWVRHAPSAVSGQFCGHSDPPLDPSIAPDYGSVARALPGGCRVYVSPLVRAAQTLEMLAQYGFQPGAVAVIAAVTEQNFGQLEGQRYETVRLPDGAENLAAWQPPGGESFTELVNRVGSFMKQDTADANIIVICHAGTIRAALAVALGVAPSQALAFAIEPLSRTALTFSSGHWQVAFVNRTGAI
jgi:alpha-ribazole phosphatase